MKVTVVYSDDAGHTHFRDAEVSVVDRGDIGSLSAAINAQSVIFRTNSPDYDFDFHNAPQRQLVVMLTGHIEIETSLGDTREFLSGDVILVEDVAGHGHRSRCLDGQMRRSLFIPLGDSPLPTV